MQNLLRKQTSPRDKNVADKLLMFSDEILISNPKVHRDNAKKATPTREIKSPTERQCSNTRNKVATSPDQRSIVGSMH